MPQILTATQASPSDVFRPMSGVTNWVGPQHIPITCVFVLSDFASGSAWKIQVRWPGETWVDTGTEFTAAGMKTMVASSELEYRLAGGATGAKAWVSAATKG